MGSAESGVNTALSTFRGKSHSLVGPTKLHKSIHVQQNQHFPFYFMASLILWLFLFHIIFLFWETPYSCPHQRKVMFAALLRSTPLVALGQKSLGSAALLLFSWTIQDRHWNHGFHHVPLHSGPEKGCVDGDREEGKENHILIDVWHVPMFLLYLDLNVVQRVLSYAVPSQDQLAINNTFIETSL